VERLLERTVESAEATPGVIAVAVVSPDPEALALAARLGATAVRQAGSGLNEGLGAGRAWAEAAGASALLVVPADLPAVDAATLAEVVAAARSAAGPAGEPVVVLVPDRGGTGTNVLLVAPAGAIPFAFGPGSRAAHAAAARARAITYVEVAGPLALDLDTPEDLLAAEAAGLGGVRAELP
jgi:2-phospho-L-lactate guanylyltransferase